MAALRQSTRAEAPQMLLEPQLSEWPRSAPDKRLPNSQLALVVAAEVETAGAAVLEEEMVRAAV
eukprot:3563648-Pleurochrysis_carterae.AAC.1